MRRENILLCLYLMGCETPVPCGYRHCGNPCPQVTPVTIDDHTLLACYKASVLGTELSEKAKLTASRTLQNFLRTANKHETYAWHGESASGESVLSGSFSFPVSALTQQGKVNCLNYIQTLTGLGDPLTAEGTACQDTLGMWRIVKEIPVRNNPS